MMDLVKVKEALERASCLYRGLGKDDLYIKEALAELENPRFDSEHKQGRYDNPVAELEKPAEDIKGAPVDSKEAAKLVFDCIKIEDDGHRKYPVPDIQWGAQVIQQYAESYHAEQCKACEKQNQWMPKSVLLPVNGQPVFCAHNQNTLFVGFFDYEDDEWYDEMKNIRDVTHWQPLPEAPK